MSKFARRAGQNICQLALKRRIKAIGSFISAVCLIVTSVLLFFRVQSSLNLPIALIFAIAAFGLFMQGAFLWKRADQADQGARGEQAIAKELSALIREGWTFEYGMPLENWLGDADIVCTSPQHKVFVIEVKSHRGEVLTDGDRLFRRMGKSHYAFEKDFLRQAVQQALQVKKQKCLSFVTPILAFSDASVAISFNRLNQVYVVEKSELVALLKSLG